MKFDNIENDLTKLLLRDLVIYNNPNKPLKKGKLKLFKVKEFYYVLTLENDKKELKNMNCHSHLKLIFIKML